MLDNNPFQDLIPDNHCFGCGPNNKAGLKIKSYWLDEDLSICRFQPSPHQCAGPLGYLNGGIIATIIDCHCVCTAIAKGYKLAGRNIGDGDPIWFATGQLNLSYQRPVDINSEVTLKARVAAVSERKILLNCELQSRGDICVNAELVAVKVPSNWF